MTRERALLVLADGTYFEGEAFGYAGEAYGEIVFNTSMTGYQEILTDPSYRGQLITMTANHVGNYGCNELDVESDSIQVAGFIVREASRIASNYRSTQTLDEYLKANKTVSIQSVDTRAITRLIRDAGVTMAGIVHGASAEDVPRIVEKIASLPSYDERDFVAEVSVKEPTAIHREETGDRYAPIRLVRNKTNSAESSEEPHVVIWDFGVKNSIIEHMGNTGVRITLMPHTSSNEEILAQKPDGVLISNGPGDPALLTKQVAQIEQLIGQIPVFGICLGHQLIGQAIGGKTFKLKFGHRGPNQPVMVQGENRVEITAQNHGYAVNLEGVSGVEITHINLNDQTVEGMNITGKQCFSVQHHPEAGPGPHDSVIMFQQFRDLISANA